MFKKVQVFEKAVILYDEVIQHSCWFFMCPTFTTGIASRWDVPFWRQSGLPALRPDGTCRFKKCPVASFTPPNLKLSDKEQNLVSVCLRRRALYQTEISYFHTEKRSYRWGSPVWDGD